jgi:hypothetical protein
MSEELTQMQLKDVLSYAPDTGVFTWVAPNSTRVRKGSVAGYLMPTGYIRIRINGETYLAHRLAHLYMTGVLPSGEIDHADGVRDNNKWLNLRPCIHAENHQNRKPRKNSSGITGVGWHKLRQKWRATLTVYGKHIHAGLFDTIEEAVEARNWLKANLHTFQPVQRGEHATC